MKKIFAIFFILFVVSCVEIRSKYYSADEKSLLNGFSDVMGYGYGFDINLKLDYIFETDHTIKKITKVEFNAINDLMKKYKSETVLRLYKKLYRLILVTEDKLFYTKQKKEWINYTYIKKHLLPSLYHYFTVFENASFKKVKILKNNSQKIKKDIKDQIEFEKNKGVKKEKIPKKNIKKQDGKIKK